MTGGGWRGGPRCQGNADTQPPREDRLPAVLHSSSEAVRVQWISAERMQ